jgi:hypothetical protein
MSTEIIQAIAPITSRVRTDVTAIKKNGAQVWTREPLTEARLAKHLNGGPARGCCPIKAGESTTMVGLFDLDSHGGESSWDQMVQVASELVETLELFGMNPIPFRSSGGRGVHVFLLWDQAQDAFSVRQFMAGVIESMGYTNGTGGVSSREIEVFPKQDSVPADGFGNQFILPLAGASEPLDAVLGMEPMGRDWVLTMAWPSSPDVPVVERQESTPPTEVQASLSTLQSALQALDADMPHDGWARVLMALHNATDGSDDGLDLADMWSARSSSKYKGRAEVAKKWASFGRHAGRREVTAGTLFNMARAAGWVEPVIDEFDALPVVVKADGEPAPRPGYVRHPKTGEILVTMDNMVKAVGHAGECGMMLAYDTFRDEIVFSEDDGQGWQPFKDADYVRIRISLERAGFKPPNREITRDAVLLVAERNKFDSAQVWLGRLQWDGVERVDRFLSRYLGTDDTAYTRAIGRYLWTALAGRVIKPGVKADMAPVLVGDQGAGKSQAVAAIAPDPMFFTEISFGEKEDDLSRKMRGRLVAELGELRGLHTRELESIKAFITRSHEDWTPKYREFNTVFPRRLVFIGTTNKEEFLADETGNRRWLPVRVGQVDVDAIKADRLQLWAEGAALFDQGGVDFREAESLAVSVHADHMMRDVWEPVVRQWLTEPEPLTGEAPESRSYLHAHEVLEKALKFEARNVKRVEEMRVGAVLRALGYSRKRLQIDGKRNWVFVKDCPTCPTDAPPG